MANSGQIKSNSYLYGTSNLYVYFDWEITNIDVVAGTATLNYNLYVNGSNTVYYRMFGTKSQGCNYLQIDGTDVWAINDVGNGSTSNRYKLYCKKDRDGNQGYASTSDGWTFNGYYKTYGKLVTNGTKTIRYDEDGRTSFTVYGAFLSYTSNSSKCVFINSTVIPDKIERHCKSYGSSDKGVNWSNDRYLWKTTDYGASWTKCNVYKTTDSGSNWDKIIT